VTTSLKIKKEKERKEKENTSKNVVETNSEAFIPSDI